MKTSGDFFLAMLKDALGRDIHVLSKRIRVEKMGLTCPYAWDK